MTAFPDIERTVHVPLYIDGLLIAEDVECAAGIAVDLDSDCVTVCDLVVYGIDNGHLKFDHRHWLFRHLEPEILMDGEVSAAVKEYILEHGG